MTKPNTDPAKTPGAGADGQAPPASAPEQAVAVISTDCLMCGKNVLDGVGGFLRIGFQRFTLRDGDVAELLENPEGESDLVLVCTACSMMPAWVIAKRAIQAREQAAEEAARWV
jgi:hypothetical protein